MGKVRLRKMQMQDTESREKTEYDNIFQTRPTSMLYRTDKNNVLENSITGVGSVKIEDVEIVVENCKENVISPVTNMILDLIFIKFAKAVPYGEKTPLEVIDEKREVNISLFEYMERRGLRSQKDARKQLETEIDTLYNTSLKWIEKRYITENGKKKKKMNEKPYSTRIIDTKGIDNENSIKNSVATVKLSMDVAKYLTFYGYICPYNLNILKVNSKTSAYPLGKSLIELTNINRNDNKRKNIISVKALLNRLPRIPSYEKIRNKGGISRRIIEPLERDLNELIAKNILESWAYVKSNGEHFTDEELGYNEKEEIEDIEKIENSYKDFFEWKIVYVLKDYPEK